MPSITDSIGRVLGDRYRLVTALGTGGSAHVYLADDVSLHRRVAIKVLHPALAADESFLRRFRAEARAVAALNHPNVLQVYDSGEEYGQPYLVLEYLDGGSLRELLDAGFRLSPAQAVEVGSQAAAGLDYAHRRGLIHRDIKPANLLFDLDGRLRVADFGLARALAEAAWTEPEGAMLGTARYAAPEQAGGNWVLDGKADVYALAIVLYEAVTGEPPFVGDTTVTTLMARVGALLPEHDALGPLNDILVWAAAPEVAERYDAAQFGVRLRALAADLPPPEPLPLVGAGGDGPTDRVVVAAPGIDATALGAGVALVDGTDRRRRLKAERKAEGSAPRPEPRGLRHPKKDRDPTERRRHPMRWGLAVVAAAVLAAAGALVATNTFATPSAPLPSLVGESLSTAHAAARTGHFDVRVTGHATSITVPAGLIVSQSPAALHHGHRVSAPQGSTIGVTLSSGPPAVPVPNLSSFTNCHDAVQALATAHLVGTCPPSAAEYSSTVAAGGVLGTSPSGRALYGSTVTVILSKGHAPVDVPPVTGPSSTFATAQAALAAVGFQATQANAYSSTVPSGQVISTSPPASAGPQPYGSTITVNISIGPQPVNVPNLVGRSVADATSALEGLGLKVAGPYGPPGSTTVLSTDPAAGASVQPGTTVNLYTL